MFFLGPLDPRIQFCDKQICEEEPMYIPLVDYLAQCKWWDTAT
jgi:hypothetical protein